MKRRPKLSISVDADLDKKQPPPGFESVLPPAAEAPAATDTEAQPLAVPDSGEPSPAAVAREEPATGEAPSVSSTSDKADAPAAFAETADDSPGTGSSADSQKREVNAYDTRKSAEPSTTPASDAATTATKEKRRVRVAQGTVFKPAGRVSGRAGGSLADQLERPSGRQIVTTLLVVAVAALSVYLLKRRFF